MYERMLLLLPYIIVGFGFSAGFCSAAGYTGALLVVMLILLFIAGFVGGLLLFVLVLTLLSLFVDKRKPQAVPSPFHAAVVVYVMGLITALMRIRVHESSEVALPEGR